MALVKICPSCGANNDINTALCDNCMADISAVSPVDTDAPETVSAPEKHADSVQSIKPLLCQVCGTFSESSIDKVSYTVYLTDPLVRTVLSSMTFLARFSPSSPLAHPPSSALYPNLEILYPASIIRLCNDTSRTISAYSTT